MSRRRTLQLGSIACVVMAGLFTAIWRVRPGPAEGSTDPEAAVRIDLEAFDRALAHDAVFVVDVRSAESYRAGHIPGAVNVPLDTIEDEAPHVLALAAGRPIVTYCACPHEHTSALAAVALRRAGALQASALVGGYPGWLARMKS